MAGLDEKLKIADSTYFENETVPENATESSEYLYTGEGAQLGQSKILIRAASDVVVPDGNKWTFRVQTADDDEGANLEAVAEVSLTGGTGNTTFGEGDVVAEVIVPRTARKYTRLQVITDGGGTPGDISGSVDAFLHSPYGFGGAVS